MHAHEYRLLGASCLLLEFFGVKFVHANLCMHILASIFQDGGKPFPVTRLPDTFTSGSKQRHLFVRTHSDTILVT